MASVLQFGRVLTYAHGDCSPEVAQVCHDAVAANIKASSGQSDADRAISAERSRLLPPGSHYTVALPAFNKEDPNSALLSFFQVRLGYCHMYKYPPLSCPALASTLYLFLFGL